jgi:nitroimidazol reductase NimA-like FMN-containing flavoprotein (pyridoxamine 5'-phosphate oxidase superfamily)
MRRSEKEIGDRRTVEELLASCRVGRLGTVGSDGYPMVKPLNFAYRDGAIYFHTARSGEKIDHIRRDARVCFEIDQPVAYVRPKTAPCEANFLFRSVIVRGRASMVEDGAEKVEALRLLMDKYDGAGRWSGFNPKELAAVNVVRIDVEEMVGKESLNDGRLREAAERALREGQALPVTLERD